MLDLRRRDFITLLGAAAAVRPIAASAQRADKLPTVGFLGQSTRSATSEWVAAFVQRLRELGWIENRTVAIVYRWVEGRTASPRSRMSSSGLRSMSLSPQARQKFLRQSRRHQSFLLCLRRRGTPWAPA